MHYQRFRDHDYLGAWDFEDGDRLATIVKVEQGMIDRENGAPPERVPLMHFEEFDRPLVLNATNGALIAAMYGSPDTRQWEGKQVFLTRGMTTDKQGHPCWGIRVKPERPPEIVVQVETPEERALRLEAELAKVRADMASKPKELGPNDRVLETITSAEVAHVAVR